MNTKFSRFLEAIIEAGWLAALIIVPLFFNVHSSRVFEPDKLSLLRSIALVMALAWLIKLANEGLGLRAEGAARGSSRGQRCGSASEQLRSCCPRCFWSSSISLARFSR